MSRKNLFPGALVVVNTRLNVALLEGTGGRTIKSGDVGTIVTRARGHGAGWHVAFGSGNAAGTSGNVWEGYLDVVE